VVGWYGLVRVVCISIRLYMFLQFIDAVALHVGLTRRVQGEAGDTR